MPSADGKCRPRQDGIDLQPHHINHYENTPAAVVRRLVFAHTGGAERRRCLDFLHVAEQLAAPPPGIAYGRYPDATERRRRALEPRLGDFPGCKTSATVRRD